MRSYTRPLLGVLLCCCLLPQAWAQAKKGGGLLLEAPTLPQVPELPNAFPQVVGTQVIGPAYKFTKEDAVTEAAREISKMGSRILKVNLPSGPQFTDLIAMPFTHYLVWFRPGDEWTRGFTPEMRRREYNATYLFTKDLLTRRDTTGKTFFLGHWEGDWHLLRGMDPSVEPDQATIDAMVEWANIRQKAVDDARSEVPYTRCRVYTYLEVNRVRDAMKLGKKRVVNQVLPRTKPDFVSYSAYDMQLLPAEEIRATLDYVNRQLVPKPGLPPKRVFIGECGLSWSQCGGDGKVHERKNREIIVKLLSWRPPLVLYWQFYNNEVKDGRQAGFWLVDDRNNRTPLYDTFRDLYAAQEAAATESRGRLRRLPALEEMAVFSEEWLRRRNVP